MWPYRHINTPVEPVLAECQLPLCMKRELTGLHSSWLVTPGLTGHISGHWKPSLPPKNGKEIILCVYKLLKIERYGLRNVHHDCGEVERGKRRGILPLVTPCVQKRKTQNRQTILVPESQICQRCAGTSCRFPEALVSRRSYSQSIRTHRSQRRRRSPDNAGSQLKIENRLSKGTDLFTAETLNVSENCTTWELMWLLT